MQIDKDMLEKLKQQYKKISLEEKEVDIMKKNIQKAKQENKKRTILAIAGAMAVFVAVPNISPSVAMAMEKIPVIGSIVDFVTIRDYSDLENNISVEAPKATGENESLQTLNKTTDEYIKSLIANFKNEYPEMPEKSLDITYDILTDNTQILSLRINGLEVGASGYMYSKIYNVDKKDGNILSLKDIFKEDSDYVNILSENIKMQMKQQMEQDENKIYFLETDIEESNFEKIKEDQNFYFNDKNELVLCFDEYEVAPGYMGAVEFTIPKDVTKDILR